MTRLRLATVVGDVAREADLVADLAALGGVDVVLRCGDRVELIAGLRAAALDAVVLVGWVEWFDRQTSREAAERGVSVVALATDARSAEGLSAWVQAVIPAGGSADDIIRACTIGSLEADDPLSQGLVPSGHVVAVWGPKGSPGRTRVAIELAHGLSNDRTLLIDGDTYGGDVAQLLGLSEELPNTVWATQQARRGLLDLTSLATQVRSIGRRGPAVLPGIDHGFMWSDVSLDGWVDLLELGRELFDWVVVDTGFCLETGAAESGFNESLRRGRNDVARHTLTRADVVVAVCRADILGVTRFCRTIGEVRELSGGALVVVLNAATGREGVELERLVRRRTTVEAVVTVPNLVDESKDAMRAGRALSEARRPRRSLRPWQDLAQLVRGQPRGRRSLHGATR